MLVLCKLSHSSHFAGLAHGNLRNRPRGASASKSAQVAFGHKPKEKRMNVMEHHIAIREKANQMGSALWSLAIAAIVGFILWASDSAVPWWVYPILFAQSVVGFARVLSDEPVIVDLADYYPIEDADEDATSSLWPSQVVSAK
jgi:hypothetical protein